ncbi:MAG: aminotransferase class V-fold PLP-dependent enzyme [Solirubrobacteraceae bacterium]
MDAAEFRSLFPVCRERAYFNAGTCGPLAQAAVDALTGVAAHALAEGRAKGYYESYIETRDELRAAYARALGAEPADVAVTTSTSEGIVRVLLGLNLATGDEVLIAADEHPGLLGPLAAVRDRLGLTVREVALADIADAVSPATRLVACSHVGWTTGEVVPSLAGLPDDLPVLLDGAQGVGAVPVDLEALGCSFYAGSGQKWLCGPVGTGMLWVSPTWRERLRAAGPTYLNLDVPADGLQAVAAPDGRAFDAGSLSLESAAGALAAAGVLEAFGWEAIHARARSLAAEVADGLRAAGRDVAPRGDTTLVTWVSGDADAEAERLLAEGVVVRSFPGLPLVRASVGAWNDQSDVERLLAGVSAS